MLNISYMLNIRPESGEMPCSQIQRILYDNDVKFPKLNYK